MRDRLVRLLALTLLGGLAAIGAAPSAYAETYVPITGEGSSWAANALQDWAANVHTQLRVNFAATGSVAGPSRGVKRRPVIECAEIFSARGFWVGLSVTR